MIKINLLPYRAARKKEIITRQIAIGSAPLLLACLIIGSFWWSINASNTEAQNDIADLKEKIKQSSLKMKDIENFKTQKELLEKKLEIIASLQKNKTGPVRMLDALSTCLPGNLWLINFIQKGTSLQLDGRSMDNLSISRYMVNLEKSQLFNAIELGEIKTDTKAAIAGGHVLKMFKMKSEVNYSGDVPAPATEG
jgi:type IV pilus assembly protein PilN